MFAANLSKNISKGSINHNDQLIRFVFNYHYDFTVGKVTDAAFQVPHLEKGLSVSVARLLDHQTRQLVIQSMENTNSTYVMDCLCLVREINSIRHIITQDPAFNVELTPVFAAPNVVENLAHAEISYSAQVQSLSRAEKKQYRRELMKKFNL